MYNQGMGGADLMDQESAAYRLDCKSKVRFYLRFFFDIIDVALVNSLTVYTKVGENLSLPNFKVVVVIHSLVDTVIGNGVFPYPG